MIRVLGKMGLLIMMLILTFACAGDRRSDDAKSGGQQKAVREDSMAFKITSPAFADGDTIPMKYTCDGDDISPALRWSGAPAGTKSFVLICDDPDAPMRTWVHWVLFNLGPKANSLDDNFDSKTSKSSGEEEFGNLIDGINDFRRLGYGGPCPPKGPAHRYFFRLYALDLFLGLKTGASREDVERAIDGHILAKAELVGKYKR